MKDIHEILEELGIGYEKHEHSAVFTTKEARKHRGNIVAGESKNLFLRNRKGNKHYLVVMSSTKQADLKNISKLLNESNLSFASEERLMKYLGLTKGSVSPFGLINDDNEVVTVIVDSDLMENKQLGFHPNINTATLVISSDDFRKFLDWTGNKTIFADF